MQSLQKITGISSARGGPATKLVLPALVASALLGWPVSASSLRAAVAIRINVNGPSVTGIDFPGTWSADPGSGGVCGGTPFTNPAPINGTVDDAIFQGEVYGHPVSCAVGGGTLPPGLYQVNLYFAEIFWGPGCPGGGAGTGARVFDIVLEGTKVLSNLDIFAEGGCAASTTNPSGHPVVKSFTVAINDGTLNIDLPPSADEADITAIEVLSTSSSGFVNAQPGSIDFGSVAIGSTATRGVTLTNLGSPGDPTVIVQDVVSSGLFGDNFIGPVSLAPGGSVTFNATYSPATVGPASGILQVLHNGNNTPLSITVQGQGSTLLTQGFSERIVFGGLTEPTVVRFAPDGRVVVAEKSGAIKIFNGFDDPSPDVINILQANVHDFWDRGLLGMAIDPGFPVRPYVYVLYTYDFDPINPTRPSWNNSCPSPPGATTDGCVVNGRLSRLKIKPDNTLDGAEQVLIENKWCQQFPSHSVGSLVFGPEGALYASAGEGASFYVRDWGQLGGSAGSPTVANPCGDPNTPRGSPTTKPGAQGGALRSQDLRTSGDPVTYDGSVVRIDPDTGAAWPDNPLIGGDPADDRVIAYGLRNPFRMTARTGTSEIWIGDVGWDTWEEINRIVSPTDSLVENFGWPCYEGIPRTTYESEGLNICSNLYNPTDSNVVKPYFPFLHGQPMFSGDVCATNNGSAIAGLAFYDSGMYPASYHGALFFADYARRCISVMFPGAGGNPDPASATNFVVDAASPVDLEIGPGGDLYYVDLNQGTQNGGTIRRIQYSIANRPPRAVAQASPSNGPVPLTVQFDGTGSSDPDPGTTLSYRWDLDGDGQFNDSTLVNPSRVYTQQGTYNVGLMVTDDHGATDTTHITITAGNAAPTATILSPASSMHWRVGDVIPFSGSGSDSTDGPLPPSSMHWQILLHHCPGGVGGCHVHPLQTFDGIDHGAISAPDHEYYSFLEFILTVTDSGGLAGQATVSVDPQAVTLNFESDPPGLMIAVGATSQVTPFSQQVIVGSLNSIAALSPQVLGASAYYWTSWTDGGPQSRSFVASATPQTFHVIFAPCQAIETICDSLDNDCDGIVDNVPVPAGAPSLTLDGDFLSWSALAGATGYDIVRGDVAPLAGGGGFTAATSECLGSGLASTSLTYTSAPATGQVFWFLVRGTNCGGKGTYDSNDPGQVGSEDAAINVSPSSCP